MHANLGAINDPIVKPAACAAEFEVEPRLPIPTVANALLLVRTLGRQRGRTWSIAMTHHAAARHRVRSQARCGEVQAHVPI
jgi:hypothetical protein